MALNNEFSWTVLSKEKMRSKVNPICEATTRETRPDHNTETYIMCPTLSDKTKTMGSLTPPARGVGNSMNCFLSC